MTTTPTAASPPPPRPGAKPGPTPAPRRMTLEAITQASGQAPLRVLLLGPEGIGKTTFGAAAPTPVFLGPEGGTSFLAVKPRSFPEPRSWADVLDAVRELIDRPSPFQTLVLDTLDWLEPLCWKHVCEKNRKANIEAFGFGKGYVAALDEWRHLVGGLEKLRRARGMHVVMLAHTQIKTFKNPEGEDYDRFNLKLNEKAGGLLKEWSDAVLFANYKTHVTRDEDAPRAKGYAGGARFIYTERRAAFDAKNRFGLPFEMPLEWDAFFAAYEAHGSGAAAKAVRTELDEAIARVRDEAVRARLVAAADAAGDDTSRLRVGLNKVSALLAAQADADAQAAAQDDDNGNGDNDSTKEGV